MQAVMSLYDGLSTKLGSETSDELILVVHVEKGLGLTLCVAHSVRSGYMGDARK